jgi:hypothetical protein
MSNTVDDLTIEYVEDGVTTVKQLDKMILSKGAWATVMFRYQDFDRTKEIYGPDKYAIRRYQKKDGEYKLKSKFTISSRDQGEKIIDTLKQWMD